MSVAEPVGIEGDEAEAAARALQAARAEGRFPALTALRLVHSHLLRRHDEAEDRAPGLFDEVEALLTLGVATGAILDENPDRWEAQSLLDFWYNAAYRAGRRPARPRLARFDEDQLPRLAEADCPYLGLAAFLESDSGRFYGRQALLDVLLKRLATVPLLAVVGSSGGGKSSVVRAGLIPALRAGTRLPGSAAWAILPTVLPGSNPLLSLAKMVAAAPESPDELARALAEDHGLLARRLDRPGGAPVVLVVDQFEEVFTLGDSPAVAAAFLGNLLGFLAADAAGAEGPKNRLVLTMRSDFEVFVMKSPELRREFERGRVLVTPLERDELRAAIEEPARQVGLVFERGVVDRLLEDTYGEPGALPLLQFTLMELWRRRRRNKVPMEALTRLGGARLALATVADELFQDLLVQEQEAAKRIFLRLVRPGEGLEVTNRRIPRRDLFPPNEDHGRIGDVLGRLIDHGLVRETGGPAEEDRQVEVAHEALVRNWPRLVEWLNDERAAIVVRQRLEAKVAEWVRRGRGEEALLDEAQIADAGRWLVGPDALKLGTIPDLPALIDASRAAIERRREELQGWKRYALILGASTAALLILALGWMIWSQAAWVRDVLPMKLVLEAEHLERTRPDDVQLRTLLATEAVRRTPGRLAPETRQAFYDSVGPLLFLERTLELPGPVVALAVSRSGLCLAAATEDRQIRAYRAEDGALLWWGQAPGPVFSLAFSPDDRRLAAVTFDPDAIADLAGTPGRAFAGGIAVADGVSPLTGSATLDATAPKGDRNPASPGAGPGIALFEAESRPGAAGPVEPISVTTPVPPATAAFSADGSALLFAGWNNTLHRIDLKALRANPDAASCCVQVWPASQVPRQAYAPAQAHAFAATPGSQPEGGPSQGLLGLSPDGRGFVTPEAGSGRPGSQFTLYPITRGGDGVRAPVPLNYWNPQAPSGSGPQAQSTTPDVVFSPDGGLFALVGDPSTAGYSAPGDEGGGGQPRFFVQLPGLARVLTLGRDGQFLATLGGPSARAASGPFMSAGLPGQQGVSVFAAADPQVQHPGALGRLQVLAGQASSVHLLDPDSGRVAARAPHEGPVTCAQFDAGGRRLYTAGRDRAVKVWRLDVGLATPRDPGPAAADGRSTATLAADFAPDGTLLAEAIVNGPTLIPMKEVPAQQPPAVEPPPPPADAPPPPAAEPAATQPESGEPALPIDAVQAPPVPEVPPVPVRREPDFAAASTWRTVRVRHAGDVTSVGEWPVHAEVQSLRFSPDGGHVLAITQPFGFAYGLPTVVFRKEASFPVAFARISPPAVGSDDPEAPEAKRFALHLFPVGSPRGRTVAMPGPIAAAAIGPQGSQYAAATWGGRATLLDLAGGAATSFSYSGPLGVALDAGGDRAATVDWDHSVRIWGRKGQAMAPIARVENPGPVAGLRFSPDGSRLAIVINLGGPEGFMGLFHADRAGPSKARFRVVGTSGGDLVAERDAVNPTGDLQFSPDGSLLAIPSGPVVGKVFVWDLDGKSSIDHPGPVEARDRFPLVYDEASGRLVARPAGGPADRGNAYPYPIAFSPDGRYLAIVQDGLLGLNEARSGRIVAVKQSGDVGALRFSRVGSNLLAVGADGMSLRAWSVPDLRPVAWASMPHDRVTLAGFHPDGTGLIWVDGRQILQVRFHAVRQEFEELIKYRYIDELVDYLIKVRKSPGLPLTVDEITEAIIAHLTTPDDQGVRDKLKEMDLTPDLLDLKKGDVLLRRLIRLVIESKDPSLGSEKPVLLGQLRERVEPLALSPDGRFLTVQAGAGLQRLDLRTLEAEREPLPLPGDLATRTLDGAGRVAAAVALTATTEVRRADDDRVASRPFGEEPVYALAYSPDGRYLAAASLGNRLLLQATGDGTEPRVVRHPAPVTGVIFSPSGRLLATTAADNRVRVWPLGAIETTAAGDDPPEPIAFPADAQVGGLAFSHDDRYLGATGADGAVRVWDLAAEAEAQKKAREAGADRTRGRDVTGRGTGDRSPGVTIPGGIRTLALAFGAGDRALLQVSADDASAASWWLGPRAGLRAIPWGTEELVALASDRSARNLTAEEWREHFGAMPYHRTIDRLPAGAGVTWRMTAAPRRQLPGVIALALGVVALFLLVIPAGAVRSELGGRRWVSWAMLLLLAGLGWGAATVPIVWTDVFALPAVLEKLMFVAALGGIALLCTRLQPRLLAALSPEATDRPLEALADRWSRSARPRLARYVGRGELR